MDENNKNTETETVDTQDNGGATTQPTGVTAEEFNAKMAELMAENNRLRAAVNKATADASNWKKKFTATQSEAEQLSMEKAEREAAIQTELEALRKESAVNKYAKSFLAMGYSDEQAQKAAEAQFANDTDELFKIQKAFNDEYAKKVRQEIMKTMPAPSIGNDDNVQMTQAEFDAMTYSEQLKLYREHPVVYEKFAN